MLRAHTRSLPKHRRRKRAEAAARNCAFQWLEKVHVNKGAAAPMLLLNTPAHHAAVNDELSHIAAGGLFTSGHHSRPPPHAHRRHAPNATPLQGCNVEMGVKTLCAGAGKNGT